MNRTEVVAFAIERLKAMDYKFHRCLGATLLNETWIDFVMNLPGVLTERPRRLWEVRFQVNPPSDTYYESHPFLSVLVNDETHEVGLYR